VIFEDLEMDLRQRLEALPPAARAELLHVLRLPDLDRAEPIGEFWSYPQSRNFAELLIDCEEGRTLRSGGHRGEVSGQGPLSQPFEHADGSDVSFRPCIANVGPSSKHAE
jgi:hypothetical protein